MTSTPKWQSPRLLSRPIAKAPVVSREVEEKRRIAQSKSGMQSARSRGWHRGARR